MKLTYREQQLDYENRGIDYDLQACLRENSQNGFTVDDIEKVLAVYEGENDGESWHWILSLKNGKFVYLTGGCDYTGWDCQSFAESTITENMGDALLSLVGTQEDHFKRDHLEEIHRVLYDQLFSTKNKTWRETMDDTDLGQYPKITK